VRQALRRLALQIAGQHLAQDQAIQRVLALHGLEAERIQHGADHHPPGHAGRVKRVDQAQGSLDASVLIAVHAAGHQQHRIRLGAVDQGDGEADAGPAQIHLIHPAQGAASFYPQRPKLPGLSAHDSTDSPW